MSVPAPMRGLSLDQAPPLAVPAAFFVAAPGSVVAAGALMLGFGSEALASRWLPATLGLTHLATLGYLSMVMFGALYQMLPVVAGARVPLIRLAHAVHGCLVVGVAALVVGLAWSRPALVWVAITALCLAVLGFVVPVTLALARAGSSGETVQGMRFAVFSLLLVALLGLWMAHGHAGALFPGDRALWVRVHVVVGLLGWVGGLLVAVSWQVVPMFYLAEEPGRALRRATLGLLALGVLLPPAALLAGGLGALGPRATAALTTFGAAPAVFALWVLHPACTLRAIARRRRRRTDGSLRFWRAGMALGPVVAACLLLALFTDDPRFGVLFGWLAVWGWAGLVVHGMLSRIVPFLVWFHRFSPLAGRVPIPSMKGLLSERRIRLGFGLHASSVVAGALAILTGSDAAARLTGLLVALSGVSLCAALVSVLRRRPASAPSG